MAVEGCARAGDDYEANGATVLTDILIRFPTIFAAGATWIEKHEQQRKQKSLRGEKRGTDVAAIQPRGAVMGSLGLVAFAASAGGAFRAIRPPWLLVAVSTGGI